MPIYEFRFLRPDGNAKRIDRFECSDDREAYTFAVENFSQKPLEIWLGDHRVSRRTSPRFENRLAGIEIYKSSCRYPALSTYSLVSLERDIGQISQVEFDTLGRLSNSVFANVRHRLDEHAIWVRAQDHPAAPTIVRQHARISIHPATRWNAHWSGGTHITIWSREDDGQDILSDLTGIIATSADDVHQQSGARSFDTRLSEIVRDGAFWAQSVETDWKLPD